MKFNQVIILLNHHFDYDESKVAYWLNTKNTLLGNKKPIEMIIIGRIDKLLEFVTISLMNNKQPLKKDSVT